MWVDCLNDCWPGLTVELGETRGEGWKSEISVPRWKREARYLRNQEDHPATAKGQQQALEHPRNYAHTKIKRTQQHGLPLRNLHGLA